MYQMRTGNEPRDVISDRNIQLTAQYKVQWTGSGWHPPYKKFMSAGSAPWPLIISPLTNSRAVARAESLGGESIWHCLRGAPSDVPI